jgi:hypothetical protein
MLPEGLGNLIIIIHLIGSRTRDLQVCKPQRQINVIFQPTEERCLVTPVCRNDSGKNDGLGGGRLKRRCGSGPLVRVLRLVP